MQIISTVTSPASSYDLTILANVKDELSISDGISDTLLRRYITSASKAAANYCNRVFSAETVSDSFYAERREHTRPLHTGPSVLQLSRFPVVSITSVVENSVALVENTDFLTDKTNGQLTRLASDGLTPCRWLQPPVTVVYVAGYATIPTDIEDAVIRMVTQRFNAKGRDATVRQEAIPGLIERQYWVATGTDAGNITPDVADLLDNYRAAVIA